MPSWKQFAAVNAAAQARKLSYAAFTAQYPEEARAAELSVVPGKPATEYAPELPPRRWRKRETTPKYPDTPCEECKRMFTPRRLKQRCCSAECRRQMANRAARERRAKKKAASDGSPKAAV